MASRIREIRGLMSDEQYDRACSLIGDLEKEQPLAPYLLILKGVCIQLGSENTPYELKDVEIAYLRAIETDPNDPRGFLELGFFYSRVMDQPDKSIEYFEKAKELLAHQMTEMITGLAEAIAETKSPKDALQFVASARDATVQKQKIDTLVKEITAEANP